LVGWSVDVEEFDLQVVRDLAQEAQHQASQRDPDRERRIEVPMRVLDQHRLQRHT
jgi:hypothetical protein